MACQSFATAGLSLCRIVFLSMRESPPDVATVMDETRRTRLSVAMSTAGHNFELMNRSDEEFLDAGLGESHGLLAKRIEYGKGPEPPLETPGKAHGCPPAGPEASFAVGCARNPRPPEGWQSG